MTRNEVLQKYPEVSGLARATACIQRHWAEANPQTLDDVKKVIEEIAMVENYIRKTQRELYLNILLNGDLAMLRSGIIRKLVLGS